MYLSSSQRCKLRILSGSVIRRSRKTRKSPTRCFPPLPFHRGGFYGCFISVYVTVTSSSLRRCSFCSSIRFWRSWRSWRLCSSGSRHCAASWACCLFSASERSLFSCCSRRKSRLRVDSPGTFRMELQGKQERERDGTRKRQCAQRGTGLIWFNIVKKKKTSLNLIYYWCL